jgi:hypothetical protein
MSFDLCRKTDRGSLTDLGAKNGGLDSTLLATTRNGNFQSNQLFQPYSNFVNDTSIRTTMEGQRNKYSAIIPEQGDLLTGATIVIRDIHHKPLWSNVHSATLIENIEIRINGQCIQSLSQKDLDVPYEPVNGPSTYYQGSGYQSLSQTNEGPWYIPINAFFSKDGNSYPLIDSQYPLEIHVTFQPLTCLGEDNDDGIQLTVGGQRFDRLGCNDWHQHFEITLMTHQTYLSEEERDDVRNGERDMFVVQRDVQEVPLAKHTDVRIKLDSNLPLRSLRVNGDRVQSNTMVRFLINREPRFEHFFKYLQYVGEMGGFNFNLRIRSDNTITDDAVYYFGEPGYSPNGRCNLSMLDDPTVELHGLAAGEDGTISITTESYNLLRWKDGRAYLVLHKSR